MVCVQRAKVHLQVTPSPWRRPTKGFTSTTMITTSEQQKEGMPLTQWHYTHTHTHSHRINKSTLNKMGNLHAMIGGECHVLCHPSELHGYFDTFFCCSTMQDSCKAQLSWLREIVHCCWPESKKKVVDLWNIVRFSVCFITLQIYAAIIEGRYNFSSACLYAKFSWVSTDLPPRKWPLFHQMCVDALKNGRRNAENSDKYKDK